MDVKMTWTSLETSAELLRCTKRTIVAASRQQAGVAEMPF